MCIEKLVWPPSDDTVYASHVKIYVVEEYSSYKKKVEKDLDVGIWLMDLQLGTWRV